MTIPVICDRCRTTGASGTGDFAHLGDLLAFEPVPRKVDRVDGWTAERQRAFIAALSATGSKRKAAQAVGMAAFGVDQMLKAEGSASFAAAYARAREIAQAHGSMKIAQGVADAAARNAVMAPPSRLRDLPPQADADDADVEAKLEILDRILLKYQTKISQEREHRLAGEIAAADFTLRQLTVLEIGFELLGEDIGSDAVTILMNLQRGGFALPDIAATTLSRMLDGARRAAWIERGEPMRPDPVDEALLLEAHDGAHAATVQLSQSFGRASRPPPGVDEAAWQAMTIEEQKDELQRIYAHAAAAQIAWEAAARREYEERTAAGGSASTE